MPCNPDKIKLAVFEQTKLITDFSDIVIQNSDKFILNKIPDGGNVAHDDNQDSIIYGHSEQAPVAYRSVEYDNRALVEGTVVGRAANSTLSSPYTVDINDIPDNACHGQTEIDYSQGFRRRSYEDRQFDAKTPVKCVRDLDRFTRTQATDYFMGMRDSFANFGMENFSADLINQTILQGEANASIMDENGLNLTTGGWEGVPTSRLTIFHLQEYRDEIMMIKRGLGQPVSDDYVLEIEAPFLDWADAVREDQIQRNGNTSQIQYPVAIFEDTEGNLKKRKSHTYGGIKCYFNAAPVRGYYKPKGDGTFSFTRVKHLINAPAESYSGGVGGLILVKNDQYRRNTIVVDGITYPMVTLIPHIDPMSFTRFGKMKPIKPVGGENVGVNYDVKVIDGPYIDCNEMNDKFRLVARHEYRFRAKYPELSGWIAYLSSQQAGYTIDVNPRVYGDPADTTITPETYRQQEVDACTTAECEQCDKVVDGQTLQCIDPEDATAAILALTPSGSVTVVTSEDNPVTAVFYVERTGGLGSAASVNYATTEDTALSGTDFTQVSGTLTWEAGDTAPKAISVPILAGAGDGLTLNLVLSGAVNATITASQDVATITIDKI